MRRDGWERDEDRNWGGRDDGSHWSGQNWSRQDRGGYGAQENARGGYGTGGGTSYGQQYGPQPGNHYPQHGPQYGSPQHGGSQYGGSQWGSGFGQPSAQNQYGGSHFGQGPYAQGPHEAPVEHRHVPWSQGYNVAPSMPSQMGMGTFTEAPSATAFHFPHTPPSVPFNRPDWEEGRGHTSYRRGQWRGRTPKNYQRSDERIRDEIIDRLVHESDINASDVEITVVSGVVTLSGTVNDRRVKHHIEDVSESALGVTDVTNNLRVDRGESRSSAPSSSASTSDEKSRSRQRA